jgi:hypothetical protein
MSLEQTATEWVNLLIAGEFDQAVKSFDNTVSAQITAAKLKDIWNSLIAQFGAFKDIKGTKTSPYGAYNIVFVTCNFDKAALDIQLSFDAEKKVAGLFFKPPT